MLKKKYLITITMIFILFLSIFLIYTSNNNTITTKNKNISTYNNNPDNSKKIIASLYSQDQRMEINNIDQLVEMSDLIIVGKIKSSQKSDSSSTLSISKVEVEKVIYGKISDKKIELAQIGEPNNNNGETKVILNNRMVLILTKSGDHYSSVDVENGLFVINKSENLTSLSDNIAVAKYDNRNINLLLNDLKTSIAKIKK